MLIESCAVPPFEKNGYVVACPVTGEAIVIDPGDEVDQLIAIVRRTGVTVRYIMLTHSHLDHISGCNEAKAEWDVPLVLHKDDLFLYERAVQQGIAFGIRMRPQPPIDAWFDRAAALDVRALHGRRAPHARAQPRAGLPAGRPGAGSPPSTCSSATRCLPARSAAPTCLAAITTTLLRSVRDVLFPLGDDCRVYPGHGPATTIGEERRSNPFLADERRTPNVER